MGFFKRTLGDILTHIDRVMSSSRIDEDKKKKRLAELELEAKMAMASERQNYMLTQESKGRIPSVPNKRVFNISDSRRTRKLNKYSFSQKEQYEILDRRARFAKGEHDVYSKMRASEILD